MEGGGTKIIGEICDLRRKKKKVSCIMFALGLPSP